MAITLKKKKEESTNEKIVRLFQEGKTVEEICAEVELKYDIVANVIRRRLGEDAVPETVITAKPKEHTETAAENDNDIEEHDGMSKLERYMLEKKKKQSEEAAEEEKPSEGRVSLVDDYKKQANLTEETVPTSVAAEMDSISIDDVAVEQPAAQKPAESTSAVEMDSISAVELAEADASAENNFEPVEAPKEEAPAEESAEAAAENSSKAMNKMKAFALSQIETNNAKIAELETKSAQLEQEYAPQLDEANAALTECQNKFADADAKLSKAYADTETAREEHRAAIAKADEEYRKKLEQIDEEYKNATAAANAKFQDYEESSRAQIEALDNEKTAAQADLSAKQSAVTDLRAKMASESEEIAGQIKALKDENDGYNDFL